MRKKYLYSNYNAPRTINGIDVVSDLFSEYYFSFKKEVGVMDAFFSAYKNLMSALLIIFLLATILISIKLFVFAAVFSISAVIIFSFLVLKWFSFKTIFYDLRESQVF